MAGNAAPFMYSPVKRDSRFPEKEFDPKAVTRASYEKPKKKRKQDGPLVSIRHPDAYGVIGGGPANFRPMSDRSKGAIKWIRRIQILVRGLQVVAALGILTLFIVISNVAPLTAWVMRVTGGITALHCLYSVVHHSRSARSRTPASTAAYQIFSCVFDLATMGLYTFGGLAVRNQSGDWKTLLSDQSLTNNYFIPAAYYTLIAAGSLHLLSLANGLYLAHVFRRITQMPPDMNPLEDHLTARTSSRHKRNKSSVATYSTISTEDLAEKRMSALSGKRRSGAPYQDVSRPPSIPFMHTRGNSRDSTGSAFTGSPRDSRVDLPSRQYQVQPTNSSPRSTTFQEANYNRQSAPVMSPITAPSSAVPAPLATSRSSFVSQGDKYATYNSNSRPSTAGYSITSGDEYGNRKNGTATPSGVSTPRQPKFTEAWYTSDSLVDRTNQRAKRLSDNKEDGHNHNAGHGNGGSGYSALAQPYDLDNGSADIAAEPYAYASDSDNESGDEQGYSRRGAAAVAAGNRLSKVVKNGGAYSHLDRQDTLYRSGYYADDVDLSTGISSGRNTPSASDRAASTTVQALPPDAEKFVVNPLRQNPFSQQQQQSQLSPQQKQIPQPQEPTSSATSTPRKRYTLTDAPAYSPSNNQRNLYDTGDDDLDIDTENHYYHPNRASGLKPQVLSYGSGNRAVSGASEVSALSEVDLNSIVPPKAPSPSLASQHTYTFTSMTSASNDRANEFVPSSNRGNSSVRPTSYLSALAPTPLATPPPQQATQSYAKKAHPVTGRLSAYTTNAGKISAYTTNVASAYAHSSSTSTLTAKPPSTPPSSKATKAKQTPTSSKTGTPVGTRNGKTAANTSTKRKTWAGRARDSSIQPEEGMFVAKAYGDLKSATPPVMLSTISDIQGSPGSGGRRQVSSGTDFYERRAVFEESYGGVSSNDLGGLRGRNVSGKVVEEGRGGYGAGTRYEFN